MEDQQAVAGDLIGGDAEPTTHDVRRPHGKARRIRALVEEHTPVQLADTDADDPSVASDAGASGGIEATVGDSPIATPTSLGRLAKVAVMLAAAVFVVAAAVTGAAAQPYLAQRATNATKLQIARTAAAAITTLWSYTPQNMEQLADRASAFLSPDFTQIYRKYLDAIVPTNRQAQVTNTTQVVGVAVESLASPDAVALVYTNSTSTSPLTNNVAALRYLSYRLTLRRNGLHWMVTTMAAITNVDLTPQT